MNPKIPHCQRCGTNIPPSEAVPYLDAYGRPIPGMFRNWCLLHWSQRMGALPPSHPDFFKPIDARTKRKDKQLLGTMVGYAAMHGRSSIVPHTRTDLPSPDPSPAYNQIPFQASVSNVMARARGQASMFQDFERLGKWLRDNPEALEDETSSA